MRIHHISAGDVPLSSWGGGSSRQYFIYPPGSSYAAKDFSVRISTAQTLSDDEAAYTKLPGVTRYLAMIEGRAIVTHQEDSDVRIVPMEPMQTIDLFDGGIPTTARGRVTDFNLMLANAAGGRMFFIDRRVKDFFDPRQYGLAVNYQSKKRWLGFFRPDNLTLELIEDFLPEELKDVTVECDTRIIGMYAEVTA